MPYAVELFFDHQTDALIRKVWADVSREIGQPDTMTIKGSRPHLALAVFENSGDLGKVLHSVEEYARSQRSFGIRLDSIGTFSGPEGAVFLGATPGTLLLEAHAHSHSGLTGLMQDPRSYYEVGKLTFHCTLCMGLSDDLLGRALIAARQLSLPIVGRVESVGLVKFPKTEFLGEFSLAEGPRS